MVHGDGGERGIGRRIGRSHRAESRCGVGGGVVSERLDEAERDLARGDRAGLVEAERVDPGEQFDRCQLLGERLAAGQGDDAGDEAEAGEKHEAVGHHRHRGGDGGLEGLLPAVLGLELTQQQQQRGRRDDDLQPLEDLVDAAAELAAREFEAAGFVGELRGVGVGPHVDGLIRAGTGRDEGSRQHLVADDLLDRIGLAGEERLVDLEAVSRRDHAVDHDLITGLELEQIVGDHATDPDLRDLVVATYPCSRRGQHGESVERAASLDLLGDADHAVGDDDAGEQGILGVAGDQDQHEERADDRVHRGEHVGPDDLCQGPYGSVGHVVDAAVGDAFVDFGRSQAREGGCHSANPESS